MTPIEQEFYIKMGITLIGAGLGLFIMNKAQKKKEAEAERQFQRTLEMIELRNKKYKPKENSDESEGKT